MESTINEFSPVLLLWILFVAVFGIAISYGIYRLFKKYLSVK